MNFASPPFTTNVPDNPIFSARITRPSFTYTNPVDTKLPLSFASSPPSSMLAPNDDGADLIIDSGKNNSSRSFGPYFPTSLITGQANATSTDLILL
ncbi:MAG: hypothetical protein EOP45_14555 [Sphingobacteriaceae bacterium]|nr:MAG: hypothetical protein EOP45_14555 [Sphingobacteriaceae bacterium]